MVKKSDLAEVERYLNCKRCLNEAGARGETPAEYQRLSVGITGGGTTLVACERHGIVLAQFKTPEELAPGGRVPPCEMCAAGQPHTHH